ncbi:MAG: glycoside hydrolase family 2 TIM barrel-domain containing protein [Fimbriimonadaceae bacterium]
MSLPTPRVVLPLLTGWEFRYESIDGPVEAPNQWRPVEVPHDYSIEDLPGRSSPFDPKAPGSTSTGYTLGGVGWYRRTIQADPSWRGRMVRLYFDGVYQDATVWLNGKELLRHPYGYTPFWVDLTEHLDFEGENELLVRTDTSGRHTRWYSGSGIYRPVELVVSGPTAFEPWGVLVDTPTLESLRLRYRIQGSTDGAILRTELPELGVVRSVPAAGEGVELLNVHGAEAWSPERPRLYDLVCSIVKDGTLLDREVLRIGFRTVAWNSEHGLLLNGLPIKLKGGCAHHDNGCLGAKAYPRAEERRVRQMKDLGFNAVRTAHNPPSSSFLEACDRLGLLVLDEAFDQWTKPKNPQDYHRFFNDHWKSDVEAMVLRDCNHPSVIAWSIGNEIPERAEPEGVEIARRLAAAIREIDGSRPVTAGVHCFWDQPGRPWREVDPAFQHLDIAGYNYQWREYEPDRSRDPSRLIWGTESFPNEAFANWMTVLDHPWVIGDFVWTGLDYVGEAGIGRFRYPGEPDDWSDPRIAYTAAGCGDIDLTGEVRPQGLYRKVVWGTGPGIQILVDAVPEGGEPYEVSGWGWSDERPSWTWPGCEGRRMTVRVYSRHPRIRLSLNGRAIGEGQPTRASRFTAEFKVPFEPGELVAEALDAKGRVLERRTLATAGRPVALAATADRTELAADGLDLAFVEVEVTDATGRRCPLASHLVRFQVEGPFVLEGVCSGDIRSTESFRQPERRAWRGRCLAVLRSTRQPAEGRLIAEADGLDPCEVAVRSVQPGS